MSDRPDTAALHRNPASPGVEASVRAQDLTIRFTRADGTPVTIVEHWHLNARPGELHCIAGRSGSGKTSILRATAGLLPPTAGTITWWGTDIATLSGPQLRTLRRTRIGYVDQAASLLPELTITENVLLPLLPDGRSAVDTRRPHATALLDQLGLTERLNHRPTALSGGERQRVALARALITEPDIVLADEPTASLDRALADQVIGLLRHLAEDGITVLAASHDPNLATAADHTQHLEQPAATPPAA